MIGVLHTWLVSVPVRTATRSAEPPYQKWFFHAALLTIAAYGARLRVGDQALRDLWLDEAWRVRMITNYASPLAVDYPIQWSEFVMGKVGLLAIGHTPLAFRIWPLVFSLVALVVLALVANKLLGRTAALVAVFLFSINEGAIEHAHEFKPFAYECLLSLVSLYVVAWIDEVATRPRWPLLALIAVIATTAINLMPFTIFLVPMFLSREAAAQGRVAPAHWTILIVCAAVFGLEQSIYRPLLANHDVPEFWARFTLLDWQHIASFTTAALPESVWRYQVSLIDFRALHPAWASCLLLVVGGVSPALMLRRRNGLALFILFPLALMLALSTLGLYPALKRVSYFFTPFAILSLAYFLDAAIGWLPGYVRRWEAGVVGLTLVLIALYAASHPPASFEGVNRNRSHWSWQMDALERHGQPGELLIVSPDARHLLEFHPPTHEFDLREMRLPKLVTQTTAPVFVDMVRAAALGRRVWILTAHPLVSPAELWSACNAQGVRVVHQSLLPAGYLVGLDP